MHYRIQSGNWAFLLHRLSGVILIAYLLMHIFVLTNLYDAQGFSDEMKLLSDPLFQAFEFMLFLPILFHSLNGIRLVIVEWTHSGSPNHKKMLLAVYAVSVILATAMLVVFLNHEPYNDAKVNDYLNRINSTEQSR